MTGRDTTGGGAGSRLVGREADVGLLRAFVDRALSTGGALVLTGEAGVGKTALLESASQYATETGATVLTAAGAQFEADLSYAGLNQLLYPLLDDIDRLAATHRRALTVALGLSGGSPPGHLALSTAVLDLLHQAAGERGLLIMVDDLPWFDRASSVTLGFIAHRLAASRIAFLAALRSGEEGFFDRTGIDEYEVDPLDNAASAALLTDRFPTLAAPVRQRLVAEAQGNPLALLELPASLTGPQRTAQTRLPALLPLSRRLQNMFAARIAGLPAPTRRLLLAAVLDGTGDLDVLRSIPVGHLSTNLAAAERAQLVRLDRDEDRLLFRHPLTRSAVVQLSTSEERRETHRWLAEHYQDQPDRRAWHLLDAAVTPDPEVASILEGVADATLQRGDAVGAVTAMLHAVEVSPRGRERSRRTAEAAYLAANITGDLRRVTQLLDEIRRTDPGRANSMAAAVAASSLLLNGDGDVDTAHRLLVSALEMQSDIDLAEEKNLVEALHTLLLVCLFGGRPELYAPFDAVLSELGSRTPELLWVTRRTVADPARTAREALDRLDAMLPGLESEANPSRIVRLGIACAYVDRLASCRAALWRVVEGGRAGGAVASAIEALFLLGNDGFFTGEWDRTLAAIEEGLKLCDDHGYRVLTWPGVFLRGLIHAARGRTDVASSQADEMTGWATPRGVALVQCYAAHVRALAAFGEGDVEAAYQYTAAVSPAGVLASHNPHAMWLVLDLTEAAARTNRHREAAAHAAAARQAGIAAISPRLALLVAAAAAVAAPAGRDVELFEEALSVPGTQRWPFDLARVHLIYGERLRRTKATTEGRRHLTQALETFQRLGAEPWVERASAELRATGLAIPTGVAPQLAVLTPQQQQIAMLAAQGMTNKQIGARLALSPRTVATHLYQLFPKLGVTSRAGLRDALTEQSAKEIGEPPRKDE
ncbi:regulatory protein, luxR family [Micromonospora rhizosphaerae]|uniref:Regulatory protein, luxR family n=1 Tax=Micromonospora rhizosphaerae TaxID=568872 RepID=A0A1C6SKW9_9ACTN|nr:LuxR family transcriptional regulator [Micromonospora rhizosphaerae]SCL30186.1 regulatory protein, luxR family [Micromonospora rhizosphaerae]